jgi:hypothetical protein
MPIDAGEAAIRTVIAEALIEHSETSGRGFDALFAMQQAEAVVDSSLIRGDRPWRVWRG